MKVKKDFGDTIAYVGVCLMTFGLALALRVVITRAIRVAFKEED